jgi:hypothetical protein
MFDFLRNLTKSAEAKRQETIAAYVDGALNDRERQQFEQEMAQDAALRAQVEQLLLIKQSLRRLPQREVPRNFILDPAAYGRPARQPWVQAYPVLRTATALAAFFFIFAIAAGIFTSGSQMASAPAADVAQLEGTEVTTFNAEDTADEAVSGAAEAAPAAEIATDSSFAEAPAAESAAEESALVEEVETMEQEAEEAAANAAAESVEETAEEPLPATAATQEVPPAGANTEETTSDDGDGVLPAPEATREAQPTPSTPRVSPPTPLPDRAQEDDAAAEAPEVIAETESAETTAVLPEETVRETPAAEPVNTLFWLQLGLGALLLLLLGLTFYARRQR